MSYLQALRNHRLHLSTLKHSPGLINNLRKTALDVPSIWPDATIRRWKGTGGKKGDKKERKECPPGPAEKPQLFEMTVKTAEVCQPELLNKLDPGWEQPKVVIVGAGMAGLSAAEHLTRFGFKCITILEAKDRPGGRIWTCTMDKIPVELGADKIYGGTIVNPMVPVIARDMLSANNLRKHKPPSPMIFLTETGNVIKPDIVARVRKTFDEMIQQAKNIYRKPTQEDYPSLKEFFDNYLDSEIPSRFKLLDRSDAIKVVNSLIVDLENEWGTELSNISASYYGSRLDIPGSDLTFDKGFANILKPMLKNMATCCLFLKKPVKYIKWDLPSGCPRAVIVTCDNEEVPADYVIVTFSLGVLKTQSQELFCPSLPEEKYLSMEGIGYGHINKVFLQYEKPFWVNREPHLKPATSCDESDWLESVGVIEEAPVPFSNVLVATLGGHGAKEIESVEDCDVVSRLQRLIRCTTGDLTLPYPKSMLRTNWTSDGHFCGAKTYMSSDSNIGDIMSLSEPVPLTSPSGAPVLFFAGEATTPSHYGTVHGARLSGIREADRIIHLTKLFCGVPPKMENQVCAV